MKTLLPLVPLVLAAACASQHHNDDKTLMLVPAAVDPRARALARIDGSTAVRLAAGGRRVEGVILRLDSQTVTVGGQRDSFVLPLAGIDSAWQRRDRTSAGASMGVVVAGVIGAVMLGSVAGGLCETDSCTVAPAMLLGGMIGAVTGAVAGGLLGRADEEWEPIRWPRQAP